MPVTSRPAAALVGLDVIRRMTKAAYWPPKGACEVAAAAAEAAADAAADSISNDENDGCGN